MATQRQPRTRTWFGEDEITAALLVTEKELLANVAHELRTPLARIGVGEADRGGARRHDRAHEHGGIRNHRPRRGPAIG